MRVVAHPAIHLTVMASIPWECIEARPLTPSPRHGRGQVPVARDLVVKPFEELAVDGDVLLGNRSSADDGVAGMEPVTRPNRLVAAVCADADGYWLDVRS